MKVLRKERWKHRFLGLAVTGFALFSTAFFAAAPQVVFGQIPVPQTQPVPLPPPTQAPIEPYIAINPDIFYPLDDILYVEGRSDPNATVTLELQKAGDKPVKFTVRADSSGEWVVAEKTYLSAGNWEVRAKQLVGSLSSGWSNPRVIRSVVTGVTIFGLSIRYVVIAGVALAFLASMIGIYIYFRRKIAALKRGLMERQLRETETRFHQGFAEIRKDLMDQLKDLAASADGRPLSAGEIEKRDHILRELESLEQGLEHDVGDIGRRY